MDLVVIALLSALELSLAMPVIAISQSNIELSVLVMIISANASVFFIIRYAAKIHAWLVGKYQSEPKWFKRTEKFMAKYGTIGTGVLAPLVLGPVLTSVSAIVLGAKPVPLFRWVSFGISLWSFIFYVLLTQFGVSFRAT